MGKKKKQKRESASPAMLWLNSSEAQSVLCPNGYHPLSQDEEVLRCVHRIADLVSNMTLMLMENGQNGDVRIHNELSRMLDITPSPYMNRKAWTYRIVSDLCLYGNALVLPQTDKKNYLKDLRILDTRRASFEAAGDGYRIRLGDTVFQPDEVLHFVLNPDPDMPFRGLGFSPMIRDAAQNLLQAGTTKAAFLKSKWKPSLIVSTQADTEELFGAQSRRDVLDSYTKTTEIGEPWVIPTGEISVQAIKPLTLQDLAIQDSISLDKKVLAAAMGIAPYLIGAGAFHRDEYNHTIATTILSIAMILQQEMTRKLIVRPDWYLKFNINSLMQYDLREKMQLAAGMVSGGMMTRNEARNEFDYTPVDKPGMNDFIILENFIPVSQSGNQKKLKGKEEAENE